MTAIARARLAELQRRFGDVIRAPLDRTSGTLRAVTETYDRATCSAVVGDPDRPASERLAVYNRQYWFRLFGVFHTSYRLATALCGPWALNELVATFLLAHPPTSHDLGRAIDGFEAWALAEVPESGIVLGRSTKLPRMALIEALRIDDAYRVVFEAPDESPLQLSPADADRLARSRLRPSRSVVVVEESWALVELRRGLPATSAERWVALPPKHADGRRAWAVCRIGEAHRVIPLAPAHVQLLRLLQSLPLVEALAMLEQSTPANAVAEVAANAQRWFADGMRLGFWTGLEEVA